MRVTYFTSLHVTHEQSRTETGSCQTSATTSAAHHRRSIPRARSHPHAPQPRPQRPPPIPPPNLPLPGPKTTATHRRMKTSTPNFCASMHASRIPHHFPPTRRRPHPLPATPAWSSNRYRSTKKLGRPASAPAQAGIEPEDDSGRVCNKSFALIEHRLNFPHPPSRITHPASPIPHPASRITFHA